MDLGLFTKAQFCLAAGELRGECTSEALGALDVKLRPMTLLRSIRLCRQALPPASVIPQLHSPS